MDIFGAEESRKLARRVFDERMNVFGPGLPRKASRARSLGLRAPRTSGTRSARPRILEALGLILGRGAMLKKRAGAPSSINGD